MRIKIINSFFALLILCAAQAQPSGSMALAPENSVDQMQQREDRISGWADAEHYLLVSKDDGKTYKVNARSGERSPHVELAKTQEKPKVTVFLQEKDIFVRFGDEQAKRLTQSPDVEEKNLTLSPDQSYVAFTRAHDLYSIRLADGKEVRYTSDATDVIYNGWSSWVYYEEILGRPTNYKAFWWSPDSEKLAFMRFDDTNVPMFPIYVSKGQHGYLEETRYPKAGDENPKVRVGFVKVEGSPVVWADFDENDDQYFGQPYWSYNSSSLMVQWMNRDQNNLKFYAVNPADGSKSEFYDEKQPSWINLDHDERITYLADNKHYILKSDRTGWAHYYLYNLKGELISALTEGEWQVSKLQYIDEKNKVVYFTARKENSATQDLYRVDYSGKNFKRLTFGDYTHNVSLSPDGKYFISTYSNVATPTRIALVDNKGKVLRQLQDSEEVSLTGDMSGKTIYFTVPSEDGKFQLPVVMTYPLNFDENKVYPVVMSIYGGPDAGTVKNTWRGSGNSVLAEEGIIQVSCDHRASGHFGKQGVAWIYRSLGQWELVDYITIAKWLKAKPWVADNKLLITGHSYGGYMTLLALTKGSDYFDYGIAGAPVTGWELYDTHYTERFMDTPQDNAEGYKVGSVLSYVKNYKGGLRVLHGDLDDNVHMQNTMQLVDALTDQSLPFELMIYPGSRHGFGRSKSLYDYNERMRFYRQYLLDQPVPAAAKR